jgi:NTP pyrophosphatase (non-canonical NTP hydrolase)
MGEEMGEIGRVLQYMEGTREADRSYEALCDELASELADLMAFLFKLASQHGIDMGEAMQNQLRKFVARYKDIDEGRRDMARYVSRQEQNVGWIKGEQA